MNIVGYRTMRHLIEYKNPVDIDRELKAYRNANGCITPELAMDYLNKTNHVVNMRFIARNISSLDEKEWDKYKDFVLEAIEGRAQVDEVMGIFIDMAKKGNYLEQFVKAHQKEKIYGINDKVYFNKDKDLEDIDLSEYGVMISNSVDWITIKKSVKLPKVVIFKNVYMLKLHHVNLDNCKSMVFEQDEGANPGVLWMQECQNLPNSLDLSTFNQVDINHCDLKNVEDIKFGNSLSVKLFDVRNFPQKLDFSDAKVVFLDDCDFSGVKSIVFGECDKADLSGAKNLPKVLDFSKCKNLVLDGCDFEGVETIYFKDEEEAMLVRDGINFENVDVFVGARKDPFDMNRITNSLLFLPKRKHIWDI